MACSPLTDEQRISVVKELWAFWRERGHVHMDQAAWDYEREAKERLAEQQKACR